MRAKIQAKVAAAYNKALADAVRPFTGGRSIVGEYDPVTGTTPSETVEYEGRGVFGSYKAEELTQHILATDTKLSGVLQNELLLRDEQGAVTDTPAVPKVDDVVSGQKVVAVMQDPASATWSLALRRT